MRVIQWESGVTVLLESVDLFTIYGLKGAQVRVLFDLMMAYQAFTMRRTRENTQLFTAFMARFKGLLPADHTARHVDDELVDLTNWLREVLPSVRQLLQSKVPYVDGVFRDL